MSCPFAMKLPSGRWSNPGSEAWGCDDMSRNFREPVSASKHKLRMANPPERAKPSIDREAMGKCIGRVLRGDRGRHVSNDPSRNLGDPLR